MSDEKAPWVKWQAEKFLGGVAGMSVHQIAVYSILLNVIYDAGGPVKEDHRRLALICGGMRIDRFAVTLDELVSMGKILRHEGVLSNPKAEKVLNARKIVLDKKRLSSQKGGEATAEKFKKINGHDGPSGVANRGEIEIKTQSLREERKQESPAEGAGAGAEPPMQPRMNGARPRSGSGNTRLPRDWKLPNEQFVFARQSGLNEREIRNLEAKFKSYHLSARSDKAMSPDWDQRWQSWVIEQLSRLGRDITDPKPGATPINEAAALSETEWKGLVANWESSGRWNPRWGPAPDRPGFLGPKKFVHTS